MRGLKTAIRVSNVLSWINMVIWGYFVLQMVLAGISTGAILFVVFGFFLSAVVLHNYAAQQLTKSLRDPAVPLDHQTPAGIRFIGLVALLFGVIFLGCGFIFLFYSREMLKIVQAQSPMFKEINVALVRKEGIIVMLPGLAVTVNVFLSFRLLRWYYLSKDNAVK